MGINLPFVVLLEAKVVTKMSFEQTQGDGLGAADASPGLLTELLRHSIHRALSQCTGMCSVSHCSKETCVPKGKITDRKAWSGESGEQISSRSSSFCLESTE